MFAVSRRSEYRAKNSTVRSFRSISVVFCHRSVLPANFTAAPHSTLFVPFSPSRTYHPPRDGTICGSSPPDSAPATPSSGAMAPVCPGAYGCSASSNVTVISFSSERVERNSPGVSARRVMRTASILPRKACEELVEVPVLKLRDTAPMKKVSPAPTLPTGNAMIVFLTNL